MFGSVRTLTRDKILCLLRNERPLRALLNNLVLELAKRGLFRTVWSQDALFELGQNLVKSGEDPAIERKRSARWGATSRTR